MIHDQKSTICKKEPKETKHWLRMIAKATPKLRNEAKKTMERSE